MDSTFTYDRRRERWVYAVDGVIIFIMECPSVPDVEFWMARAAHQRAEDTRGGR